MSAQTCAQAARTITPVSSTGTVTMGDENNEIGGANLKALGSDESRVFSNGTRTEIRDAQTGVSLGRWVNPDGTSGHFARQNCWTDATWFFPLLGSLAAKPSIVLLYLGLEQRNGSSVQHIRSYVNQSGSFPSPRPQDLSAIDFYLDGTSLLPMAITYKVHPDNQESSPDVAVRSGTDPAAVVTARSVQEWIRRSYRSI